MKQEIPTFSSTNRNGMGHICKLGIMSLFLPQGCIFEGLGAIIDIDVWVLLVNITVSVPYSVILGEVDPGCSQHLGFQRNRNQGKPRKTKENGFHFLPRERSEICSTFGCLSLAESSGKLLKRHKTKNLNETNN